MKAQAKYIVSLNLQCGFSDYDADIEVVANCYYEAGKSSGPMEDSYPEYSECEIISAKVIEGYGEDVKFLQHLIDDEVMKKLEDRVWEMFRSEE